jgi:arylsulfatase A-like enzyme
MDRRIFIKTISAIAGASLLQKTFPHNYIPGAKRPNFLIIMTDQQSADAMSCRIGKKYLNTPAIDELALKGINFTNAYSANPLCVPCRTSLFTGMYSHQTKVEVNSDINNSLAGKFKNLGEIFKNAGYDTGYVGKWHMAFPVKDKAAHGFEFLRSIKNGGVDDEIPGGAEEFLKISREKPFLLVTSFVNPHNICEWARDEKLPDGEIGKPPVPGYCPPAVFNVKPMNNEPDIIPLMKKSYQSNDLFPVGDFNENKWREYRWSYYRMIEKVDELIGKVLKSLQDSGHYENTVIVFMSDHGDMQGAHGWSQKTVFFEESSKVPLIICEPGNQLKKHKKILVNTGIDIIPTLCGYAGIALSHEYPGIDIMKDNENRDYIVVENKMVQGVTINGSKPEPSGRMVRSRKYKYCVYDLGEKSETLIDLINDPGEMYNLARDKKYYNILKQHRRYLAEWKKKTNDTFKGSII